MKATQAYYVVLKDGTLLSDNNRPNIVNPKRTLYTRDTNFNIPYFALKVDAIAASRGHKGAEIRRREIR